MIQDFVHSSVQMQSLSNKHEQEHQEVVLETVGNGNRLTVNVIRGLLTSISTVGGGYPEHVQLPQKF